MVRKKTDLTNRSFGRLRVIKETDKPKDVKTKGRYWLCECRCGSKKKVLQRSLTSGNTKSCGCLQDESRKETSTAKDLKGEKFGRLTVLEKVATDERMDGKHAKWRCVCDCGNERTVASNSLIRGTTKSCGCLQKEIARERLAKNGVQADADMFRDAKDKGTETYIRKFVKEGTNLKNLDHALAKNNTSGVKGVYWDKSRNMWMAAIQFRKESIYLGRFKSKQDAINARKEAEKKYFDPIIEKYNK